MGGGKALTIAKYLFKAHLNAYVRSKLSVALDAVFLLCQAPYLAMVASGEAESGVMRELIAQALAAAGLDKRSLEALLSCAASALLFWLSLLVGKGRIPASPAEYLYVLTQPVPIRSYLLGSVLSSALVSLRGAVVYAYVAVALMGLPLERGLVLIGLAALAAAAVSALSHATSLAVHLAEERGLRWALRAAALAWLLAAAALAPSGEPPAPLQLPLAPLVYAVVESLSRRAELLVPSVAHLFALMGASLAATWLLSSRVSCEVFLAAHTLPRARTGARVEPVSFSNLRGPGEALALKVYVDLRRGALRAYLVGVAAAAALGVALRLAAHLLGVPASGLRDMISVSAVGGTAALSAAYGVVAITRAVETGRALWVYRVALRDMRLYALYVYAELLVHPVALAAVLAAFTAAVADPSLALTLVLAVLLGWLVTCPVIAIMGLYLGARGRAAMVASLLASSTWSQLAEDPAQLSAATLSLMLAYVTTMSVAVPLSIAAVEGGLNAPLLAALALVALASLTAGSLLIARAARRVEVRA